MARRAIRRMGRGRRQKVVWEVLNKAQTTLPTLILTNANGGLDGAMTSVIRWRGSDVTLLRTIFQSLTRVTFADFPVDATTVLEICLGLSPFDSIGDTDGKATNTTIGTGAGPLDDADNSRWFARCCVLIPIGRAATMGTAETPVLTFPPTARNPSSSTLMWVGNTIAANQSITWWCEWDSRTKRKMRGSETEWLQLALQAKTSAVPAVGDDITVALDAFSGRVVKTQSGLPETT